LHTDRGAATFKRLKCAWNGFSIDASVVEADASRNPRVEGKLTTLPDAEEATRPVRDLDALDMTTRVKACDKAFGCPRS
jgi:hypothetical protein